MQEKRPVLRLGHSPDPDDAFMWWPLAAGDSGFEARRFRYELVAEDIESLNHRAERGELEITALSCAQYPRVADRYVLANCGASVGEQYGPRIVAAQELSATDLHGRDVVLAVPGERTTAFTAASILLGPATFRHAVVPFERIIERVVDGEFAAGLVIHEGQLTYADAGLHLVADLGMWWSSTCGLPLPLGLTAVRRDVAEHHGADAPAQAAGELRQCIEHALAHREQALAYALSYARGLKPETAERFVTMYVNRWTLDLGPVGRAAVRAFLKEAYKAGLAPDPGDVRFVG